MRRNRSDRPLLLAFGLALALVAAAGAEHLDDFQETPTAPEPMDDGAQQADRPGPATDASEDRLTVCHVPPGNPGNAHEITVGESAVAAHRGHGDHDGACD